MLRTGVCCGSEMRWCYTGMVQEGGHSQEREEENIECSEGQDGSGIR
jgi:hypothetical protein